MQTVVEPQFHREKRSPSNRHSLKNIDPLPEEEEMINLAVNTGDRDDDDGGGGGGSSGDQRTKDSTTNDGAKTT